MSVEKIEMVALRSNGTLGFARGQKLDVSEERARVLERDGWAKRSTPAKKAAQKEAVKK